MGPHKREQRLDPEYLTPIYRMALQQFEQVADQVSLTILVEGANGPTTPVADVILKDRGLFP